MENKITIEKMSGFAMWLANNAIWRNGSQDLWYSMKLKFDKDKTSTELAEMYLKTLENEKTTP